MARHKAARKPTGRRRTKFPAHLLPPELLHMVFAYLKPTKAACLRLAGRVFAEIGIQYIVPTVHLRFNEASYDRLLAVAQHPVASKYVVRLEYETEGLRPIDRDEFDEMLRKSEPIPQQRDSTKLSWTRKPDWFRSERAWRAYKRKSFRSSPTLTERQTTRRSNRAWTISEMACKSQEKVQQANFFPGKIMEAMNKLRNLVVISTPAESVCERYLAIVKGLLPTYSFEIWYWYEGVSYPSATSSVLLAAESAGLRLDEFHCQRFHWLTQLKYQSDFAAIKRSLYHLKAMDIWFPDRTGGIHPDDTLPTTWQSYLNRGILKEFVTTAPNLKVLRLSFGSLYLGYRAFDLDIGSFCWSSLEALSLDRLSLSDEQLVDFFKRHARTLKDLSLKDMMLTKGLWDATFHRIRQAFNLGQQLDACRLFGEFKSQTNFYQPDSYDMDSICSIREGNSQTMGQVISDYIQATNIVDISFDEYIEAVGLIGNV